MLAAVLIVASLAAPTTLTDHGARSPRHAAVDTTHHDVKLAQSNPNPDPNAPDHEPSFVEQYLTYQLAPTALPQTRDGLVMSHVLGYLLWGLCGGLWGPVVAIDGAEFSGDVFVSWLLSSIIWGVIASAASFTGIGLLVWLGLPYLQTTATLNAIDRQLKAKGYTPEPTKTTNKPPDPTTPPPTTDTPPPSYAY
jgi:hypothetical protein